VIGKALFDNERKECFQDAPYPPQTGWTAQGHQRDRAKGRMRPDRNGM